MGVKAENVDTTGKKSRSIRELAVGFSAVYALGYFFPERWWGCHSLAFLPPIVAIAFVAIAAYLIWFFKPSQALYETNVKSKIRPGFRAVLIGAITVFVCYQLPMVANFYGDAPNFVNDLSNLHIQSGVDHWRLFLDPNIFNAKIGERTVLNGAVVLSQLLGTTPLIAFRIFMALIGGVYVGSSVYFAYNYFEKRMWSLSASILLCLTPFALLFFGYIEIYAPAILFISLFLMCVLSYLKHKTVRLLLLTLACYILAGKFHFACTLLLMPCLTGIIAYHFIRSNEKWMKRINWKNTTVFVLIPMLLIVIYIYVGVLGDHVDPRWLEKDLPVFERLFLPFFSPESPLDRYNLLSANHIGDFFNEMLLWSGAGVFSLILAFSVLRKFVDWNRIEIVLLGVTLICFAGFFFMVNPLLGMPVDWDLLSLPAPVLLLFIIAIWKHLESKNLGHELLGPIAGIALLGVSFIPVHWSENSLSHRFESVGVHTLKTYWITGAADVELALSLEKDEKKYEARLVKIIDEVEKISVEGNDPEHARLLRLLGNHYLLTENNPEKALDVFEEAYSFASDDMEIASGLMNAYFLTGNYQGAFSGAQLLLKNGYPTHQDALMACIHMSFAVNNVEALKAYAEGYQKAYPGDQKVVQLLEGLAAEDALETLKKRFGLVQ